MEQRNSQLHDFQKQLSQHESNKQNFVNAEVESSSESEQEEVRIVPSRRRKKDNLNIMLMEQLLHQQNSNVRAQKKIYELQSEIDVEEVKKRYLTLDLNNAQVQAEEEKNKRVKTQKELFYSRAENWITRFIILLYIVYMFL